MKQKTLATAADENAPGKDLSHQRVRKGSVTEELERLVNRAKSRVRVRVDSVFGVVKRLWGCPKAEACSALP